jgi:TRAP-type mannitol/chloroaromatic compound transport system permease small subunit
MASFQFAKRRIFLATDAWLAWERCPASVSNNSLVIPGGNVNPLLALSRLIDAINDRLGRLVYWLVLFAVLISAANAIVRKAFNMSSNAFLEIQWYLFAGIFLLSAGYTLLNNEHVRIDVVSSRFSRRTQVKMEIFGFLVFMLPFVALTLRLGVPFFYQGFVSGEMSSNAGGLVRWPVYILIPLGFFFLGLQAISELIKRVAYLMGLVPDPGIKKVDKTPEEELAEVIRKREEQELAKLLAESKGAK